LLSERYHDSHIQEAGPAAKRIDTTTTTIEDGGCDDASIDGGGVDDATVDGENGDNDCSGPYASPLNRKIGPYASLLIRVIGEPRRSVIMPE
jgi:hypothetical protein